MNAGPTNGGGAIRKRKKKAVTNFDAEPAVKSPEKSPLIASSKQQKKGVNSSQVLTSKMSKTSSMLTKTSKRRSAGINNHVVKTASFGGNNKMKKIGGSGDFVPQLLAGENKNHGRSDISFEELNNKDSKRVLGADPTLSSSRTSGADLTLFPYLAVNFDQSNENLKVFAHF